jgi:hypothetical protein
MTLAEVFAPLPAGLREQLLDEYDSLVTNFKQGR